MIRLTILSGDPRPRIKAPDGTIHGSEGDACRYLIGQGANPATQIESVWHDGRASMSGTVHAFALSTTNGGDGDPKRALWAMHPRGEYPAALVAWHEQAASQHKAATTLTAEARKARSAAYA